LKAPRGLPTLLFQSSIVNLQSAIFRAPLGFRMDL